MTEINRAAYENPHNTFSEKVFLREKFPPESLCVTGQRRVQELFRRHIMKVREPHLRFDRRGALSQSAPTGKHRRKRMFFMARRAVFAWGAERDS